MKNNSFTGIIADNWNSTSLFQPVSQWLIGQKIHDFNTNKKPLNIIDFGVGHGKTTESILIHNFQNKPTIIGVDVSPEMIKKAEEKLLHYNTSAVNFVCIDGVQWLKKQNERIFDVFASGYTLHNFLKTTRSQLLLDVFKILKPEGLFAIIDKCQADDPEQRKADYQNQVSEIKKFKDKELREAWLKHYKEDNEPYRIMIADKFKSELNNIGFINIQESNRRNMCCMITAQKPKGVLS